MAAGRRASACEDASFRLVISVTALEFFADRSAIAEMVRVLAPGGGWVGTLNAEDRGRDVCIRGQRASPFHHARLYTSEIDRLAGATRQGTMEQRRLYTAHGQRTRWRASASASTALQRDRGALLVGRIDNDHRKRSNQPVSLAAATGPGDWGFVRR